MERLERYREILDCLPQPTFLIRGTELLLRNAAAAEAAGAFLPLLEDGLAEAPAVIAADAWNFTLKPMGDLVLALAERTEVFAPKVNSISALRLPLGELLAAAGSLMPTLEEVEDPAVSKQAARLNRGLYRLHRAVSNMDLASAGTTKVRYTRINLCDMLAELEALLPRPCTADGVTVRLELPERPVYVGADVQLLERAVLNLLSNALRYAAPETAVTITATKQGSRALLTVRNVGTPADPEALFGDQENAVMQGTAGVGLAVVRMIAQLMEGTLLFRILEDGTAATLALPVHDGGDRVFRSPEVTYDYSGGFNHVLMELSDVLPLEVFLPEAID